VTKRGLQKKLAQRAEANVALFENLEAQVEKAVSELDFANLESNYGNTVDDYGICALTCNNWIDALRDGDCLCITLDVGRSQAAIADPTQVVIKEIHSTIVTAQAFLDALEYSLSRYNKAHGGFSKTASGSIMIGSSREGMTLLRAPRSPFPKVLITLLLCFHTDITGVLPIFICEEHWKVAKHKMKPILGWTATLDIMVCLRASNNTITIMGS
jgi:hypothetical protein